MDDDSIDSTATPDAYINRITRNFMRCRVENDQLRSKNNELLSQSLRLVRNARELEQRMGALRIQYLELQSQNESTMAFDASLRESNSKLAFALLVTLLVFLCVMEEVKSTRESNRRLELDNTNLYASCDTLVSEHAKLKDDAEKVSHDLLRQVTKLTLENERKPPRRNRTVYIR